MVFKLDGLAEDVQNFLMEMLIATVYKCGWHRASIGATIRLHLLSERPIGWLVSDSVSPFRTPLEFGPHSVVEG